MSAPFASHGSEGHGRPEGGRGDRPFRGPRREGGGRDRGTRRRSCAFCVDKMTLIDYKGL
jgi:hypothetical protein